MLRHIHPIDVLKGLFLFLCVSYIADSMCELIREKTKFSARLSLISAGTDSDSETAGSTPADRLG